MELTFFRNTNGMANGPKTAPITAQNEDMHMICILWK
jgi:hypothetical protein